MATAPKITPPHVQPKENVLAFRTPVGAINIPHGTSKLLGEVDVSMFDKIRIVADERIGSGSNVVIRLTFTEGNELVAQLDTILLTPHSQMTRVYDVPGTKLSLYADATGTGSGNAAVDVLIYGQY